MIRDLRYCLGMGFLVKYIILLHFWFSCGMINKFETVLNSKTYSTHPFNPP